MKAKLQQAKGHLPQPNDNDPTEILVNVENEDDDGIVNIKLCDKQITTSGLRHRTLAMPKVARKQGNIKMSGFIGNAQLVEEFRLQYQAAIHLSIGAAVIRIQLLNLIDEHLALE